MEDIPKTRKTALAARTTYYFTNNPCKHGHLSKRFTVDGGCVVCRYARNAAETYETRRARRARRAAAAEAADMSTGVKP